MWCVKTDSSVDADRDVSTSADDPACQPVQLSAIDRYTNAGWVGHNGWLDFVSVFKIMFLTYTIRTK